MKQSDLSFFDARVGRHFITAAAKTIQLYFGTTPKMGAPVFLKSGVPPFDVGATCRFRSHEVDASMVIATKQEFALNLYQHLVGDRLTEITPDIEDCIGELANTIYGMAKAPLVDEGFEFPMSRPASTRDLGSVIKDSHCMEVPFTMGDGQERPFALFLVVHRIERKTTAA